MLNKNRRGSYKKMIPGLLGGHMLAIVVTMLVSSLLGRFSNEYIRLATYAGCTFFGLFFYYHEGWIAGGSDKLYIDAGQIKFNPAKGFVVGAISSALNLVVALLAYLSVYTPLQNLLLFGNQLFDVIYRLWFWPFYWFFEHLDKTPVLYFLPVLAMPFACGIGYLLGIYRIRFAEIVFYKNTKKDNKKTK